MNLNLLPPEELKSVKYIFLRRYLITTLVLVVVAEVVLIGILFGMQVYINGYYQETKKTVESLSQSNQINEIKSTEEKIIKFNNYLNRIGEVQKTEIRWTNVIQDIIKHKTNRVKLSSIDVDDKTKKITLKGTSETREDFLKFKESLEKTNHFSSFDSPINNLINPTNISFSLDFIPTEDFLKK